jgi:hypothetical protein
MKGMNMDTNDRQLCTPKVSLKSEKRLRFYISKDDAKKMLRGRKWKATVKDLDTSVSYVLKGCACGLPHCMCDAYVFETFSNLR